MAAFWECFHISNSPILENDQISNSPIFAVEIAVAEDVSENIVIPQEEYFLRFVGDKCRHRIFSPTRAGLKTLIVRCSRFSTVRLFAR